MRIIGGGVGLVNSMVIIIDLMAIPGQYGRDMSFILARTEAPNRLRVRSHLKSWTSMEEEPPDNVMFSGVGDCWIGEREERRA